MIAHASSRQRRKACSVKVLSFSSWAPSGSDTLSDTSRLAKRFDCGQGSSAGYLCAGSHGYLGHANGQQAGSMRFAKHTKAEKPRGPHAGNISQLAGSARCCSSDWLQGKWGGLVNALTCSAVGTARSHCTARPSRPTCVLCGHSQEGGRQEDLQQVEPCLSSYDVRLSQHSKETPTVMAPYAWRPFVQAVS